MKKNYAHSMHIGNASTLAKNRKKNRVYEVNSELTTAYMSLNPYSLVTLPFCFETSRMFLAAKRMHN